MHSDMATGWTAEELDFDTGSGDTSLHRKLWGPPSLLSSGTGVGRSFRWIKVLGQ